MSQNLIQAIPPGGSPLLQLPYFTSKVVKSIEGEKARSHMSVQTFMKMSDARRRSLVVGSGLLSDREYAAAVTVASQMPALVVSKAFFKVMGEKAITPSSLVQMIVKARFIPPGVTEVPEVNELDLEDVDPDEDDLDAILGRRPARNRRVKLLDGEQNFEERQTSVQPPLAYAPYLNRDHSPRWHIFLADSRHEKISVPPFSFTTFNKPIFDESGKPTFDMQTLKMQFQAPPQVGEFPFILHVVCDSYLGFDTKLDITLHVEDPAKATTVDEDDDISEPDEGKDHNPNIPPCLEGHIIDNLLFRLFSRSDASPKVRWTAPQEEEEAG
jgi:translocation protein SEC63